MPTAAELILHQEIAKARQSDAENMRRLLVRHEKLRRDGPTIDIYMQQPYSIHRFPYIVCYDQTRYVYEADDRKFYHASWVDGYSNPRQYLLATAPHSRPKTEDFWTMVVAEMPLAIVVMNDTQNQESRMESFWPSSPNEFAYSRENVRSMAVVNNEKLGKAPDGSFQKYRLTLVKYRAEETTRSETVLYIMKDDKSAVPGYFPQLRAELSKLRKEVNRGKPKKHHLKASDTILLVCGDGVTKNGNYCVFDIIMDRVVDKQTVGLKETVKILRKQRYGTVGSLEQYQQLYGLFQAHLQDYGDIGRNSRRSARGGSAEMRMSTAKTREDRTN